MERKVFLNCEVKSFDDDKLILEHFISTASKDSGGDIMDPDGMVVRGKPVVLFQHGLDPSKGSEPIAKPLSLTVGMNSKGVKGIIARTQYFPDDTGKRLYQKAKDGYMPNWSIGWAEIESVPLVDGGRHVKKWALMEYSQVAVGMNEEATTDIKCYASVEYEACKECKGCEKCKGMTPEYKPYPNEHACRLREPVAGAKTRRKNGDREHDGKKYDVIYQEQDGKWVEQAFRYPKEAWDAEAAKKHCADHNGKFDAASGKDAGTPASVPAPDPKATEPTPPPKEPSKLVKSISEKIKGTVPMRALQIIFDALIWEMVERCYNDKNATAEVIASDLLTEAIDLLQPHIIGFITECRGSEEMKGKMPEEIKTLLLTKPPESKPKEADPAPSLEHFLTLTDEPPAQGKSFQFEGTREELAGAVANAVKGVLGEEVARAVRKAQGKLD